MPTRHEKDCPKIEETDEFGMTEPRETEIEMQKARLIEKHRRDDANKRRCRHEATKATSLRE